MAKNDLNPFVAICDLATLFKELEVRYLVGGSVASSLFGRFRTTNDVDFLIDISDKQLKKFSNLGKEKFIIDAVALEKNLLVGKSYNIIHESTFIKIDFFPSQSPFHKEQLKRAKVIHPESSPCAFRVASPEDILLAKLLWAKKGGFSSERQWEDLEGIVAVTGDSLDKEYLYKWAEELKVKEKLKKLLL